MAKFRFTGKATGSDPTGYVYLDWTEPTATNISVVAENRDEATKKALVVLGQHPRWGSYRSPGWAIVWDESVEEVTVDWREAYPEFAEWLDRGREETKEE